MAVKEQTYQIDGFIFYGKKEAEQAKKEAAGVEYLKAKIDKNQWKKICLKRRWDFPICGNCSST